MRARRGAALLALLAGASLLPHLPAALPGRSYFFRDFGIAFYPFHAFWARELAAGRWPFWNPYVQEGVAAFPMCYPPDLLHALWPGPAAVSWLLTLHFPLAALCAWALARELGASRAGAAVAGAVYSMGGLAVASVNLYVFLQALALAPLVAWLFLRAARRGGRAIPLAALGLGLALTTAPEFVGQGLALGVALGFGWAPVRGRAAAARVGLGVALGLALAAVPLAVVSGMLAETVRGSGLARAMVLDYSLHPAALLQVLMRDFFGSLEQPLELWWGHRFFTRGFPYFVSLYLGPQALALAVAGLTGIPARRRLLLGGLALLGVWYALGPWGGLAPLLAGWPGFRSFRYPSKAFLMVHLALALLAGLGLDRLRRGEGWRGYRAAALAAGTFALCLAGVAAAAPEAIGEWMQSHPAGNPLLGAALRRDGLTVGAVALAGVVVALAVRARWLGPGLAAGALSVVLVLDLARAGAGVNPMTSPAFYDLLPGLLAQRLGEGGRVFSFGTEFSQEFDRYLKRREPGALTWAYVTKRQVLAPYTNMLDGVEGGPIDDVGAFLYRPPDLRPWEFDAGRVGEILPRLRNAGVTRILSLDPLEHAELRLVTAVPVGPTGLSIRLYQIADPWPGSLLACRVVAAADAAHALARPLQADYDPRRDVVLEEAGRASCGSGSVRPLAQRAGRRSFEVTADGRGYLVTRDSWARGWTASLDGQPARVLRANGKHQAVAVPEGRHEVVLEYQPPRLRLGLALMALGALGTLGLALRPVLGGDQAPLV